MKRSRLIIEALGETRNASIRSALILCEMSGCTTANEQRCRRGSTRFEEVPDEDDAPVVDALREENQKLRTLVREVANSHSDRNALSYRQCDKYPCPWCQRAAKALGDVIDTREMDTIKATARFRYNLLALAHRWAEMADDASRAGNDEARNALDRCAKELEKEVRG